VLENPGLTVKNNIFFECGARFVDIRAEHAEGYAFFRNLYWQTGSAGRWSWAGTSAGSLSDWQALSTLDGDSIVADPLFTDVSGTFSRLEDFRLSARSPAIGRGEDVGLAQDFAGAALRPGAATDLGACQRL
jgi:hypothetical protein